MRFSVKTVDGGGDGRFASIDCAGELIWKKSGVVLRRRGAAMRSRMTPARRANPASGTCHASAIPPHPNMFAAREGTTCDPATDWHRKRPS